MAFEKETCNKFAVKIIKKKTFSVGVSTGVINAWHACMQLDQVALYTMCALWGTSMLKHQGSERVECLNNSELYHLSYFKPSSHTLIASVFIQPFLGRASLEEAKILKSIYHVCVRDASILNYLLSCSALHHPNRRGL